METVVYQKTSRKGSANLRKSAMRESSEKLIFLDVDGVIATPLSLLLSRLLRRKDTTQVFDPIALYWLSRLCRETGAKVILSSTWRDALTIDDPWARDLYANLERRLSDNGTPIADCTPLLMTGDRSLEIGAYLDAHPAAAYAILDDSTWFIERTDVTGHLVRIENSRGIRRSHYRAALSLLMS